ncbi:MAG TPA: ABC transporter substrate-binding protein [Rhizomicrobium sp.]|jgi:phospholipid transport system substrate-binding protein|nr:ABC transporter substrate-binding protein [Rhizomicrobium sp.]
MKSCFTAHRAFGWASAALAVTMLFGLTAITVPQPATAQTSPGLSGAENYVGSNVQRGLTILNNRSLSEAERRDQFRDFLTSLTDIRRIAVFTLGGARRSASPAEIEAFVNAFRNYAVAVYQSRLKAYAGQSLKVVGGRDHGPGDFIVQTTLVDPTGRTEQQGEPIEVDFRVDNSGGHYVVIDVAIAGVWLALEERDQFTAFLEENGGNVGALVSHLNALAIRLRGGGAGTPVH